MIENKSCPRCSSLFPAEQVDGDFSGMCPRCLAGLLEPESPLQPGATFGGFEILDVLGQGGMGVVYKARQISLNRIVALKVLAPQTSGSKEFALRFDREAKVLASLNHPNVVQVHDFGREADVPYLVMEYVDGETLESAFKRLDRPRLMEVIRDVVRGLRKVHEAGLIHRDLKPANIFLSRDGAAKIGDFGLAVRTEADCHVTEHGYFVGTPHYASPEHARGAAVDARSDLYALGAILYEGFAGRPPFQAPSPAQVLAKHVDEPAPALDGPKDVAALVRRLLEKDPAKRVASAAELEAALATVSLVPPKRRSWAPAAAALLLAVAALFLFRPAPAGLPFLLAADQATRDDDFDAAATAVERARRDPAWNAQAVALQRHIAALSAAKQEEDLGHYYCFSKGEWEKGLPLIAAGEDSPYREAARKDLAGAEPADAWLELAKSAKPRWAERMRERAWAWLDAAGSPRTAELDATLEARREIDLLRLSPHLSQGRLRTSELQSLPYLPPAAYDLEIEADGELLVWLPGAGGRRVSGSVKLRVRDGRASAGTPALRDGGAVAGGPADPRVAEPRLFHVQGTLTKLKLRAVLPAPAAEVDDLIRRVDVRRDAVVGAWTIEGSALVSPIADFARIQIPVDLPEEYDFEARVERRQGSALSFGLVSGGRPFAVCVDSHYATLSGIDMIDGRRVQENAATWKGKALQDFKQATVRVEVRRGGVRLIVDGRALVDWKGARERLSLPADWTVPKPLQPWVSAWASVVRFSRITVTPAAVVDLLVAIDPRQDSVRGEWTSTRDGLASPAPYGVDDLLQIPYIPPAEYELRAVVERRDGGDGFGIGLLGGGRPFTLALDSHGARVSGLSQVDGLEADNNETTWRGSLFRPRVPVEIRVAVKKDRLTATAGGKTIIDWKADYARCAQRGPWVVPVRDALSLCAFRGGFLVRELSVTAGGQPVTQRGVRFAASGPDLGDLLRLVDPQRDRVEGAWRREGGALISNDTYSSLEIPHAPGAEYDLQLELERGLKDEAVVVMLPAGRGQVALTLDSFGTHSGLDSVDGEGMGPTKRDGRVLTNDRTAPVHIRVRKDGIQAVVDGKQIVDWKGDLSRLSAPAHIRVRDPKAFLIATWTRLKVWRITVTDRSRSQAVDLLPLVNPRRDSVKGEWTRNADGALVSPRTPEARIHLPVEVPAEYDLEITAERRSEDDRSFHIGLPVGGRNVLVTLDGFGANRCAFENVDGRPSEESFRGGVFPKAGAPVTVTCSVRRDAIRVEAAGRLILEWKGDTRRLGIPADWQGIRPTAPLIGTFRSEFRVLSARLMPVRAEAVDLLAITDPARDAVAGRWARSGQGLENQTTDAFPRVLFPVKAPAEYDLTMDVERKEGFRSLIVGLVSGESHFVTHIDGWTGTISGLDLLDNKGADQNETTTRDVSYLPLDKKARVVASVRRTGVKVAVDGRVIIDWKGDARRLSMNTRNRPMPRPGLSVGTWDSRFIIHAATLVEIK